MSGVKRKRLQEEQETKDVKNEKEDCKGSKSSQKIKKDKSPLSSSLPEDHPRRLIPELLRLMYKQGWVTGTGGGMSIKYEDKYYIAPTGVQKERVKGEDLFVYNSSKEIIEFPANSTLRPSDCTPLFFAAYDVKAGAVIHSHSMNAMLVTLLYDKEFKVNHLEMIKGIQGHGYHDELIVPIIENTAYESQLTASLTDSIKKYPSTCAVLVRRHGIYVWGDTWEKAKRHAECLDYLFEAALKMKTMAGISAEARPQCNDCDSKKETKEKV